MNRASDADSWCEAIAQLLFPYKRFGINLGLDRSLGLLARLGNPHTKVPIIHVAGTNGKGSVCAYLSSVLTAAGYQVGRYTSPHLVDWTERICINEQAIAPEHFLSALRHVESAIDPDNPDIPTQFEVLTAAAWCIFAEAAVDIAVIEVGLGGRLDATNVCDRPLATLITSISLEHQDKLGSTLAEIAYQKAGILKPNCPVIIGNLPLEADLVVKQLIKTLNCPAQWPPPAQWSPDKPNPHPWAITTHQESASDMIYPLPLAGEMQLKNSALAIATFQTLRTQGWQISDAAIQTGMASTQWPGRLQWTQWQGMQLLIDGAHNPGAAKILRQYVDQQTSAPVHWLIGMIRTKDHSHIFQVLLQKGDRLTLVPAMEKIGADPAQLAELAQSICPELDQCTIATTLIEGLKHLQQSSTPIKVLCGSLYLVGEFLGSLSSLSHESQSNSPHV